MKHKGIAAVLLPAVAGAVLLLSISGMPLQAGTSDEAASAVFMADQMSKRELTELNIVDELNALKLAGHLQRAALHGAALSIDLRLEQAKHSTVMVHRQLLELLSYAFEQVGNIEHVYLRFIAADPWTGRQQLLLAASVDRNHWTEELREGLSQQKSGAFSEQATEQLHLTLTNLWLKAVQQDAQG
ncbi:hypothetical protein JJQ72_13715 [Paenibacillus sp. F411]|uniref:hypothetical protein n=1 Tax=Paenibacillus sp. F411 TaxID=2820239 RepID=UPI001AAF050E|nr:hypothetical protein [Paenibacillus sp. F411]MBO2945029.1 hypothetical protein [Paenibacillus sp. F411]